MNDVKVPDVKMHNELRVYTGHPEGGAVDVATLTFDNDKTVVDVDELLALRNYAATAPRDSGRRCYVSKCVEYKARGETCQWDDLDADDRMAAEWDEFFFTVYGWTCHQDGSLLVSAIQDFAKAEDAQRLCDAINLMLETVHHETRD